VSTIGEMFRWLSSLLYGVLCFLPVLALAADDIFAPRPTPTESQRRFGKDCKYLITALIQADHNIVSGRAARDYLAGPQSTILNKDEAPWAGNYFPMAEGGLANRWHLREAVETTLDVGLNGQRLSKANVIAKLKALSPEDLRKLSPSEKMDIYMGYYDFRITKHELKMRGPQREMPVQDWEGFCNGVRAAGICMMEPKRLITVRNPNGIDIPFDPSDLKGLAGASYFYTEKYAAMGSPTMTAGLKNENPPNAGSFDVAIRSYLGMERRAFVIDNHPGTEIWNVSVVGYDRKILSEEIYNPIDSGRRSKARKKISVELVIDYLGEASISTSNRATTDRVADRQLTTKLRYTYELYVNESGRIVDGTWIGDAPDMAWFPGGAGADAVSGNPSSNVHLDYESLRGLVEQAAG